MTSYSNELTIAGGRITCLRCTARSTRTGLQCGRPALKTSKSQKCQFHGGRSTGPKTEEGKARIAAAHTVHGNETKYQRVLRAAASAKLSQLEDAGYLLGMMSGPRIRGRKAADYVPIRSIEDIRKMMELELHTNRGVVRRPRKN